MTLLVVDRLSRAPVRELSLALAPGECLALVGSQASALLDLIAGRIRPDSGRIRLGDDEITSAGERLTRRLGVGRSVQPGAGFASMTVRESVQVALFATRDEIGAWWRPASGRHRGQAGHVLDRVGLLAHAERGADQLDLAHSRRLDLAMVIAHRPHLLLLDDPAADLPLYDGAALLDLVRRLAAADDAAVLLATENPERAVTWADRTLFVGERSGSSSR